MPNTREKLIELLIGADDYCNDTCNEGCNVCKYNGNVDCAYSVHADYLITNGVTFAEDINVPTKWIPVSERLPEESDYYLAITDTEIIITVPYSVKHKAFNAFDDNRDTKNEIPVTHWMPLPPPPKEE